MSAGDALDDEELSTFLVAAVDTTPPADASFEVVVVTGPDAGARVVVDGTSPAPILVGSSAVCDLRLTDRSVSRRHLSLEVEGASLRLRDLGSTNGTRAGAVVVRDASLAGGEEIRLGATVLLARRGAASTAELGTDVRFGRLIGVSREMRRLFPLLRRLAAADLAVVVEGETGSGRQTVAETLHESGPRASGAFVVLDCAACSDAGEDEIADAVARARGGTIFLDEPSELSAALQPKLVRALGAAEDVRLVSGTRVDLEEAVVSRRLRDDLYHRISVARVELPPLRARAGDLPVLVAHFCHELGGDPAHLPATTLATWKTLTWPGNLRELRNAVAKQLVLGELAQLEPTLGAATRRADDWIERILEQKLVLADARAQVVEEFERRYVEYMLRATNGNVARAAAASGVARRYFQILKARRA